MPHHHSLRQKNLGGLADRIRNRVYQKVADLNVEVWTTPEPLPFERRTEGALKVLQVGSSWGGVWDCGWFLFSGTVPPEASTLPLVLRIDISGELCLVDYQGTPVRGLTTYSSEFDLSLGRPGKTEFPWSCTGGKDQIEIWGDAGCNDLFGKYTDSGTLKMAELATVREDIRGLLYDVEVLLDLLNVLPDTKARYAQVLEALFSVSMHLDRFTLDEVASARGILARVLARKSGSPGLELSAVGHAHIDLAWLWPLRESHRKTARTFATALANLGNYPNYVFGASQPQQYQWIKDQHPQLYEQIAARVAEGRWELQGGMWVEPDTNLPSGESLVRQLLYGVRFFQKEFGFTPRMVWLPDVFGYSGNLPQILKKAGIRWFMTTKLSWNKFNLFPHHSFLWSGIDGSQVLAHMPPEGTYNSSAAPRAVDAVERNYLDKSVSERALLLFGIGDGGGGPGEEHLERLTRMTDLHGIVPIRQEKAETFFEALESESKRFQEYAGELYFEMHQGTYTTQARTKWWNRRMEESLADLELLSVMAEIRVGVPAPRDELESIWKEVLLYQFHDILPGSSIGRVYAESTARYEVLNQKIKALQDVCFSSLVGDGEAIFNSLQWDREEWVQSFLGWNLVSAPALSVGPVRSLDFLPLGRTETPCSLEGFLLDNGLVSVTFTALGWITSLRSGSRSRDYLEGDANLLTVWPDEGDAWDFSPDYRSARPEHPHLQGAMAYREGPRTGVVLRFRYGQSTIDQDCRLVQGSDRIDFVTRVDWRERGRMLRVSFPTSIRTGLVEGEVQFGSIARPTTSNNSWESAQVEICAHRWVDLTEPEFGLALLNDCKYGHHVKGSLIDLNLLRSSSYPDPDADRGVHEFTYSLLAHNGIVDRPKVIREAMVLNRGLRVQAKGPATDRPNAGSLIRLEGDQFIIDAVKFAEDRKSVVVRGHECLGRRGRVHVVPSFSWTRARLVNLLEVPNDEQPYPCGDASSFTVEVGPFEVLTIEFTL